MNLARELKNLCNIEVIMITITAGVPGKMNGSARDPGKNQEYSDHRTVKINSNTEKSPCCHLESSEGQELVLVEKNSPRE